MGQPKLKKRLLSFIARHPGGVSEIIIENNFLRTTKGNLITALRKLIEEEKIEGYYIGLKLKIYRIKIETAPMAKTSNLPMPQS